MLRPERTGRALAGRSDGETQCSRAREFVAKPKFADYATLDAEFRFDSMALADL